MDQARGNTLEASFGFKIKVYFSNLIFTREFCFLQITVPLPIATGDSFILFDYRSLCIFFTDENLEKKN